MTEPKITREEIELVIRAAKGESVLVSLDMDKVAAIATLALQALAMQREGWVMVPVEPTQEMVEAGRPRPPYWDATPASKKCREVADRLRRNDWKEMLSAVQPLTSLPEPRT